MRRGHENQTLAHLAAAVAAVRPAGCICAVVLADVGGDVNANELIALLQALPEESRELPVSFCVYGHKYSTVGNLVSHGPLLFAEGSMNQGGKHLIIGPSLEYSASPYGEQLKVLWKGEEAKVDWQRYGVLA